MIHLLNKKNSKLKCYLNNIFISYSERNNSNNQSNCYDNIISRLLMKSQYYK